MGLTVYLSNTDIEVVRGNSTGKGVTVSRVHSIQMPEGCFLNGVITDPEVLEAALLGMWKRHRLPRKGIRLVINTPQISVRVLDMPIMSRSKADVYLAREFEERSGERKRLLGFYVIGTDQKTRTMKVCTEIADVEFIANYVNVFEGAGIELKEINSGIGVSINFLKKLKFAPDVDSVVMLRDGMTVTAIYLVKGEYFYSTTARIFHDSGTLEFAAELSNTISQIVQFSKSEKVEGTISHIYLAGMTADDSQNVERAISLNLSEQMTVQNIKTMSSVRYHSMLNSLETLFYPTAGLMTLTDHRNLLKAYGKGDAAGRDKQVKVLKLAIPYMLVFLLMLVITIARAVTYSHKQIELLGLNAYNTNPDNLEGAARYDEAAAKVSVYTDHVNGLRLLSRNKDSYPLPTSEIRQVIEYAVRGLGEVTIDSYDSAKGVIGITAKFRDVEMVNTFIDRLDSEDCFYEVNYTGYSEINSSGQWVANLECSLSEFAGR
ncbi:MAG: hypothetical protein J6P60_06890 [Lachnospiraceae bacterium]|nr:hypothetical protein [Lachnospiraceae bacterium]